jgi:hypothetical protein
MPPYLTLECSLRPYPMRFKECRTLNCGTFDFFLLYTVFSTGITVRF